MKTHLSVGSIGPIRFQRSILSADMWGIRGNNGGMPHPGDPPMPCSDNLLGSMMVLPEKKYYVQNEK